MERYKNLAGNSGVAFYDVLPDGIVVEFLDGSIYTYTVDSAGEAVIENMIEFAEDGWGLNRYINKSASNLYADRNYRRIKRITDRAPKRTPVATAPGRVGYTTKSVDESENYSGKGRRFFFQGLGGRFGASLMKLGRRGKP